MAKAMAAKNLAQKGEKGERPDSLALSSGVPSRTGSPATVAESPRASLDTARQAITKAPEELVVAQPAIESGMHVEVKENGIPSILVQPDVTAVVKPVEVADEPTAIRKSLDSDIPPRPSTDSSRSVLPRDSIDSNGIPGRGSTDNQTIEVATAKTPTTLEEYHAFVSQLKLDAENFELQRQDEVHEYVEKIDALQSKLQYLSKESAEAARVASGAAPSGSLEKKLADKDEQIALLMEEGRKLSKKELTHMTTIKKLRAKIQENGKDVIDATASREKAEKELTIVAEKLKRAEAFEKRLAERQKQVTQLQKERDSFKSDRDARDTVIAGLKRQLEEAASQEKQAEAKAASEALEAATKRAKDLEDDLANAKIEKNLASDRAQAQIKELREKIDKDAEKARMVDLETKNELQMLESKLEVMRARAEEVSSGATGDAQAKLLRQIETLQSQYAVASENWQGIEASLLARATNLEKERDEATKREADIRKKAREVVSSTVFVIQARI